MESMVQDGKFKHGTVKDKVILLYSHIPDEGLRHGLSAAYAPASVLAVSSEKELEQLLKDPRILDDHGILGDQAVECKGWHLSLLVLGADLSLEQREKALLLALKRQIRTAVVPGVYESLLAAPVPLGDIPLIFFPIPGTERRNRWFWLQRAAAFLLLILASPLLLLVTLAIRLDSQGPVIYKQERVGYRGKPFVLWKFRTMVVDAEAESGPVFCREQDSRITRVGRFLRHTHLDELPQLVNIVRGEMNWVGPRPERPDFVIKFIKKFPGYELRHLIPPGLTGEAQIQAGYDASPEAKLSFDLQHLRRQGLWEETRVLLATIPSIILRKGR
ncbi:sugar transferase [Paradesulfitobacterium ferrireducens]|uniref:sugar transferase n=1 Tax=Paradesulfitobacterium ferrireducens TaxID=2816476 RepID=UPI001A8E203C|nr:sugar transferase [Paradesulfitobacterium ferrireducens]